MGNDCLVGVSVAAPPTIKLRLLAHVHRRLVP